MTDCVASFNIDLFHVAARDMQPTIPMLTKGPKTLKLLVRCLVWNPGLYLMHGFLGPRVYTTNDISVQSRSLELCVEVRDGQTNTNKKTHHFCSPRRHANSEPRQARRDDRGP